MTMRNVILFSLILITFKAFAYDEKNFEKHFKLVPQPQKITVRNAKGITPNALRSVFLKGTTHKPVLYGLLKNTIGRAMQQARRNNYSIELMNGINELQTYPSRLLLLLDKYDNASTANKATAK
jgi:hypothetical protein